MPSIGRSLFLGISLLTFGSAAAPSMISGAALPVWETPPEPLLPSHDDFYIKEPKKLTSFDPGAIIRIRKAPGNLASLFNNCSDAYNIVFRTSDSNDQASWAFTILLIPEKPYRHSAYRSTAEPSFSKGRTGGTAVLSYQIAYDSASVDNSASVLINDPLQSLGSSDIQAGLERGWFLNIPDYEGPLAAFGSGVQAGHGTLDSIRAVRELSRRMPELGLDPHASFAMWGYSGGSIASEWAAELQMSYAPELPIMGVAAGGIINRYLNVFDQISGTEYAGLLVPALLGVTAQAPEARKYLVSRLKGEGPYNATTFMSGLNMSFRQAIQAFPMQNISDYFIGGQDDIYQPILKVLLVEQGNMGFHGTPRMPMFVYRAIADQFSPVADTDVVVEDHCSRGANILYHRNTVGEHVSEFQGGHGRSIEWIESLFNGTHGEIYGLRGCDIRNVSVVDTSGPRVPL